MAAANTSLLVLLDLNDEYKQYEECYDVQLFSRFTNKGRCVLHVLSNRSNVRLLHFFIPNIENTLIRARVTLFKNTIFYIYCVDDESVKAMKRTYNYPMFVKIFPVEYLPTQLRQAAVIYQVEQAQRTRHNPDEHDTALQTAVGLLNQLVDDLTEHMIVKTGSQPDDRR